MKTHTERYEAKFRPHFKAKEIVYWSDSKKEVEAWIVKRLAHCPDPLSATLFDHRLKKYLLAKARLQDEGLKRAIPDVAHLEASYRRAYRLARVNEAIADAWVAARDEAAVLPVPDDLRTLVRDGLEAFGEQAWDDVIVTLVSDHLSRLRRRRKRRR